VLASFLDFLQFLSISSVGIDVKIFRFLRVFRAVRSAQAGAARFHAVTCAHSKYRLRAGPLSKEKGRNKGQSEVWDEAIRLAPHLEASLVRFCHWWRFGHSFYLRLHVTTGTLAHRFSLCMRRLCHVPSHRRAIRALRVLRTVRVLRHLQNIVNTILSSVSALGSIFVLLFLFMCLCAAWCSAARCRKA